jgi:prepilin peptidase CpaA
MNAQVWIAILVGLAATVDDLRRRQISNWIPVAALAAGLGWQMGQHGWRGSLDALAGAAAGFAVFLIFYLLGGMGGGDIKLMAGFGALLGALPVLKAALWVAGIGGILAIGVVGARSLRKALRKALRKTAAQEAPAQEAEDQSIPYAPAIALGVWISLVSRG